ncbi:CcmD family protein [Longimicrobium sp.]|uniref:CcmD family protein n=1 Tax=Longimicrobium sp. TaxID=2029185 RepID=UPI002E334318|nr:CcmD family protein [Longimicrobium sp.]HEX6041242.1 CcmD family protein [Longimicrobium sp.]
MRPVRIALIALALFFAAPAAARAQAPAGETATEAAAATQAGAPAAETPAAAPTSTSSGLPTYTPPRTLRAYAHVFVAFAIAWVLLFGYLVFIARKFRRVEEQVAALSRA